MTLVRLDVRLDDLRALADYANAHHVTVSVVDADTIVALSSLHDALQAPIGVWLELSADYAAQMAARDVKTLSWLVALDTVVVSGPHAEAGAEVLEALLTNDEVNFTNGLATIVGAYNRPAPPSPVAVWRWDETGLRHGDHVLHEASTETTQLGVATT
ncbi:MAG: hypothetical protein ABSA22_06790, partial [Acidimicrobiales bacterium]